MTLSNPVATAPAAAAQRRRMGGSRRKLVLTVHVVAALSLLGASIAMLIGSLFAATRDDPQEAHAIYSLLRLFTFTLDIPLALIALLGGLLLALTSKWRIFRYWWVTGKLTLFLATITLGITLIGPSIDTMLEVTEAGSPSESSTRWRLSLVTGGQVAMLLAAATLGVFNRADARAGQELAVSDLEYLDGIAAARTIIALRVHPAAPPTDREAGVEPGARSGQLVGEGLALTNRLDNG